MEIPGENYFSGGMQLAKIISPLFSFQARGKVGGLTYRRYRNLNIVQGSTAGDGDPLWSYIDIIGDAKDAWHTLSLEEVNQWDEYSRKVLQTPDAIEIRTLPGYHQFLKHYCIAVLCGTTISGSPPSTRFPGYPVDAGLADVGGGEVEITWSSTMDCDYIDVRALWDYPVGIKLFNYKIKMVDQEAVGVGGITKDGLTSGKKSMVGMRALRSNGQAGPWWYGLIVMGP